MNPQDRFNPSKALSLKMRPTAQLNAVTSKLTPVIFGNIAFEDHNLTPEELSLFKTDNPRKALILSIDTVEEIDPDTVEDNPNFMNQYLIPAEYDGEIVCEWDPSRDIRAELRQVVEIIDNHEPGSWLECKNVYDQLKLINWTCDWSMDGYLFNVKPVQ